MHGIEGWLLVYLVGTTPLMLFFAAGLSGWVLDYPVWLFIAIFVVLASPLMLVVLRAPSAPAWNIIGLWVGAGMITLRVLTGVLQAEESRLTPTTVTILLVVVVIAMAWAATWTAYFLTSDRVSNTFS